MKRIAHDIVIGVDPHKASWTAAVMNSEQHVLAKIRVATSQDGYQQLRTFTAAWPQATWAVEGASGLGAPLTARLLDSDATVIDYTREDFAAGARRYDLILDIGGNSPLPRLRRALALFESSTGHLLALGHAPASHTRRPLHRRDRPGSARSAQRNAGGG